MIQSRIERNQSEEKKRANSIYNPNPSKAKRKGAAWIPERASPPARTPATAARRAPVAPVYRHITAVVRERNPSRRRPAASRVRASGIGHRSQAARRRRTPTQERARAGEGAGGSAANSFGQASGGGRLEHEKGRRQRKTELGAARQRHSHGAKGRSERRGGRSAVGGRQLGSEKEGREEWLLGLGRLGRRLVLPGRDLQRTVG